jgi:ribosomal protein L37E
MPADNSSEPIRAQPATVRDRAGRARDALVVRCRCGEESFHVFQVNLGDRWHLHLRCADCGRHYCDQTCHEDPTG